MRTGTIARVLGLAAALSALITTALMAPAAAGAMRAVVISADRAAARPRTRAMVPVRMWGCLPVGVVQASRATRDSRI
ncbi:hypothetical protein PV518_33505 [Streptomyces sp. ND04-05B]|uniref:hypothetical protein n=1 Tax=Streptomyces sp. ND04-05B TaxID=3028693 RepID=UPI0029BE5AF5|nr:hypothetical protein [Streptomyces sp. ND04-05B]MDX3067037.1 hypothetical protein [Streptomyces sp. ND04-05B]